MSSRPFIKPFVVISSGDMSGNLTSAVTILNGATMFSYSTSWAGTSPVGSLQVQCSNDYAINPAGGVLNAGTWTNLGTAGSVSGNSGTGIFDFGPTGVWAVRLIYTFVSGIGVLQADITGKAT